MYEHNALCYWSGLALCLTKSEAVEHAVLRQLLLIYKFDGEKTLKMFAYFSTQQIILVVTRNKLFLFIGLNFRHKNLNTNLAPRL